MRVRTERLVQLRIPWCDYFIMDNCIKEKLSKIWARFNRDKYNHVTLYFDKMEKLEKASKIYEDWKKDNK